MFNDLAKLIKEIDLRFTSGNSIPIDRAHIKAEEWDLIRLALWDSFGNLLLLRNVSSDRSKFSRKEDCNERSEGSTEQGEYCNDR